MSIILKAAQFAAHAHRNQFRKFTNRPYIEHPMRVAGRVCMIPGMDEDEVAAGWLHDTVEDCGITYDDLEREFDATIASRVLELTNRSKGSKLPRAKRKAMDHEHLANVSRPAKIIKAIDRIDNLREIFGAPSDFQALYLKESRLLAEALTVPGDRIIRSLLEELVAFY